MPFSLALGQVDSVEAPERIRKGMGQYPIPVVLLARLAEALGEAGVETISGAGHAPFLSHGRQVSQRLARFVEALGG